MASFPWVCIVDDDSAVRSALAFSLEMDGVRVAAHERAAGLLEDPALAAYGCLVIDYRLPVIDGVELATTLRKRGHDVPIIMITGRTSKALKAAAEKAGVWRLIEKPLRGGELLKAIKALTRSRRSR